MQNDENESPVRESGAPGAACGRDRRGFPFRFGRAAPTPNTLSVRTVGALWACGVAREDHRVTCAGR